MHIWPPCTKNRGHKSLTTKFSPYFLPPQTHTHTHAHARTLTHTFVHTQNQFFVHVFAMTPDKKEHRFLLPAQPRDTPAGLLDIALKRFNRAQGIEEHSPDDYVLKVRGEISTLCCNIAPETEGVSKTAPRCPSHFVFTRLYCLFWCGVLGLGFFLCDQLS